MVVAGRPPAGSALPPRPHLSPAGADPLGAVASARSSEAALHRLPVAGLQALKQQALQPPSCPHRCRAAGRSAAAGQGRKEEVMRGFLPHQQQHLQLRRLPPPSAAGRRGQWASIRRHSPRCNGATGCCRRPKGFDLRRKVQALGAWRLKRRWSTRSIRRLPAGQLHQALATGKARRAGQASRLGGLGAIGKNCRPGKNRQAPSQGLAGPKTGTTAPGGARAAPAQWRAKLDTSSEAALQLGRASPR